MHLILTTSIQSMGNNAMEAVYSRNGAAYVINVVQLFMLCFRSCGTNSVIKTRSLAWEGRYVDS